MSFPSIFVVVAAAAAAIDYI